MKTGILKYRHILLTLMVTGLGSLFAVTSAQTNISGIIKYFVEPNPEEFGPRMYNWEVALNIEDSKSGPYAIVQIIKPLRGKPKATDTAPQRIIDSDMITQGKDGIIAFKLGIGLKEPKQIPDGSGNVSQPVIFTCKGSGKGESNWVNFPGAAFNRVIPSDAGTILSNGRLTLIRFIVTDDGGAELESDIMLCTLASIGLKTIERKPQPPGVSPDHMPFEQVSNGLEMLWAKVTKHKQSPEYQSLLVTFAVRNISDSKVTILTDNLQDDLVSYKEWPDKPREIHIDYTAIKMENNREIIPPLSTFSPATLKPGGTIIIKHIYKDFKNVKKAIVVFDMFNPVTDLYHTWKGRLRSDLVTVE
jgi:hypothetical protein